MQGCREGCSAGVYVRPYLPNPTQGNFNPRETKKRGWPLPTVETKAKGGSWSTYEWGHSLVGSWARHAVTIDFCPALAALVCPVQNIIFLATHFFTLLVYVAQQSGQAVVLGRLQGTLRAILADQ